MKFVAYIQFGPGRRTRSRRVLIITGAQIDIPDWLSRGAYLTSNETGNCESPEQKPHHLMPIQRDTDTTLSYE